MPDDARWAWWRTLVGRPVVWCGHRLVYVVLWSVDTAVRRLGGVGSPWLWTWLALVWCSIAVAGWGNGIEGRQALFAHGEDVASFGSSRSAWLGQPVRWWIRTQTRAKAGVAVAAEVGGYSAAVVLVLAVLIGPQILAVAAVLVAARTLIVRAG